MTHAVPFQASANAALTPELLMECPTAVQAVAVEHETDVRLLVAAPFGLGTVSVIHP
jgi:hypothetical protein